MSSKLRTAFIKKTIKKGNENDEEDCYDSDPTSDQPAVDPQLADLSCTFFSNVIVSEMFIPAW